MIAPLHIILDISICEDDPFSSSSQIYFLYVFRPFYIIIEYYSQVSMVVNNLNGDTVQ